MFGNWRFTFEVGHAIQPFIVPSCSRLRWRLDYSSVVRHLSSCFLTINFLRSWPFRPPYPLVPRLTVAADREKSFGSSNARNPN
jgi:hypothetical protein